MSTALRAVLVKTLGVLSAAGAMLLTGCGVGSLAGPTDTPGFKISGNVHGGPLPIQGATIRLMTTASNGAWQTSTNSYKGTATTQLTTTSNNYGYFTFPETGWACPAGQYAYVTVTGGHTAAQANNNVVQVGVIGSCSDKLATQTQYDSVNVFVSELSTVAAAYALHDFITIDDNTGAGSGQQLVNIAAPANNNKTDATAACTGTGNTGTGAMTCNHAGLAHAFLNAYNLVDSVTYSASAFPSGNARTFVPGNQTQSVVPQAEINTLGNIMQVCVDSTGGTVSSYSSYTPGGTGSSRCGDLFYYTTPPGTTTAPTNTLQAVLNMAQYPNNNVDTLFTLQPQVKFFTPAMTGDTFTTQDGATHTMSYTLSVFYLGTGLSGDNGMNYPVDVALDEDDNVFVAYRQNTATTGVYTAAVNEWTSNGIGVFAGPQQTVITNPASIALDSLGNLFLTNDAATNGNLFQLYTPSTASGTVVNGSINQTIAVTNPNTGSNIGSAAGVAVDNSNNVWVSRDSTAGITLLRWTRTSAGAYTPVIFSTNPALKAACKRIQLTYNQNVIGISSTTDSNNANPTTTVGTAFVFAYPSQTNAATLNKATMKGSNGYAMSFNQPADAVLFPMSKELDTLTGSPTGTLVVNGDGTYTAASGTSSSSPNPLGAATDGSGNVFWPDFSASGQVYWMQPTSASSANAYNTGTLTSFFPCYVANGQCYGQTSSYLRGMAVDSSGAIWYTADSATGVLVQTLGLAAPTYPLISYAHGGVIVQ